MVPQKVYSFMKALKAFLKPFEVPQRSVKIKIYLIFISIQLSEMNGMGRVKQTEDYYTIIRTRTSGVILIV